MASSQTKYRTLTDIITAAGRNEFRGRVIVHKDEVYAYEASPDEEEVCVFSGDAPSDELVELLMRAGIDASR